MKNLVVCCILICSFFLHGCEKSSCKKVACTKEIVSHYLHIKNDSGKPGPIVVKVKEACNNRNWKTSYDTVGNGHYLIISDKDQSWFHGERKTKKFNIFIYGNNELITVLPYVIGLDCCHVYIQSGAREVTI